MSVECIDIFAEEKKRLCKECGVEVGKGKSFCKKCIIEKIKVRDKIKQKAYYQTPEVKAYQQTYNKTYLQIPKNRDRVNARSKAYQQKLRKDPLFCIGKNISRGIYNSLKTQNLSKNRRHWEDLVGYTVQELKSHLESLFTKGMSWANYGKWHIDHIIPRSFFKYKSTDDVEFLYCWSLLNLQPMWAQENLSKGKKIIKNNKGYRKVFVNIVY